MSELERERGRGDAQGIREMDVTKKSSTEVHEELLTEQQPPDTTASTWPPRLEVVFLVPLEL